MSERRKVLEAFEKQKDITKAITDAGIERYRKGNAHITLKDSDGNPLKNVKIKLKQKNHEFRFGANLFMLDELERRYKEISERYSDSIPTIEVTNELEWEKGRTAIYDEPDYMEWCFKLAEKYFPKNKLVPNEIMRLCWEDRGKVTDKYYAYLEANMLKGCRFDAIGMQYHTFFKKVDEYEKTRPYYDPENLMKHMDLYARLGKPLQVTEITIPAYSNEAEDEAIQAEIIENLYKIWFSHPNMEQIIYWNTVDGYAHLWDPSPEKIKASQGDMTLGENVYYGGLLRFDLSPKPAYHTIKNLIQNVWHTDAEVTTDENGEAMMRGFYGEYDVTYTVDGKESKKTIKISKEQQNNDILLT